MQFVCRRSKARVETQTFIIFNIYYLSTAIMVTRTLLKITFYVHCLSCFELSLVTDMWISVCFRWIIATLCHRTVECCLSETSLGIGVQSEVYEARFSASKQRLHKWKRILVFLNFSVKLVNANAYWCWSGNLNKRDREARLGLIVICL
jgi:hypothetical protein